MLTANTLNDARKKRLFYLFDLLILANEINEPVKPEALAEMKILMKAEKDYTPCIYLHIEGGNLQGISGSESIAVELFDMDNYQADPGVSDYTPDEWEAVVDGKTEIGEIKPIY